VTPLSARRLLRLAQPGLCFGLAPDGTLFLHSGGGALNCLDDSGRVVWSMPEPEPDYAAEVVRTAWAPDGDEVFVLRGTAIDAFDADTGTRRPLPEGLVPAPDSRVLAVSPDGLRLACEARGGVLIHHRGTSTLHLLPTTDRIVDLCWADRGAVLCVATRAALQFWQVDQRRMFLSPIARRTGVGAVAWSPDGRLVAFADSVGTHLINRQGGWMGTAMAEDDQVLGLAFSPSGALLVARCGVGVALRDPAEFPGGPPATPPRILPGALRDRRDLAFSAAGRVLLRTGEGSELWALSDSQDPDPEERTDQGIRRWTAAMCGSVGRALPTLAGAPPTVIGTTVLQPAAVGAAVPDLAWSPSGDALYLNASDRSLTSRRTVDGSVRWSVPAPTACCELAIQPGGGRLLLAAADNRIGRVRVLDGERGTTVAELDGGQSPVWNPDGSPEFAVPIGGPGPTVVVRHLLAANGVPIGEQRRGVSGGVCRLAWSPDGALLAAGTRGGVVVWRMPAFERQVRLKLAVATAFAAHLAWSPDGTHLAAAPDGGQDAITVWSVRNWVIRHRFGRPGGLGWAPTLAWSPDSTLLAAPGSGPDTREVELWDVVRESSLLTLHDLPEPWSEPRHGHLWSVRWAPSGEQIATTSTSGEMRVWDLRHRAGADGGAPLPTHPERLADLGAAAAAAGAQVSLAHLAEVAELLGPQPRGRFPLLHRGRSASALRALGWPAAAEPALVAVLAGCLPADPALAAPPQTDPTALRAALLWNLGGCRTAATGEPLGGRDLAAALERTQAELLPLLALLGPDAVREDPGLPHRLLRQPWAARVAAAAQRLPQLGLRDPGVAGDDLDASTGAAAGVLARHGPAERIVPWQLALPEDVNELLRAREALLYRARRAQAPPQLRGLVLVLDDTPSTFGAVGNCLRMCAQLLAARMIAEGRGVGLATLGGVAPAQVLGRTADLGALWQPGAYGPADRERALRRAARLTRRLDDPVAGTPVTLLLSHPYEPLLPVPGALALRAHFPGLPVSVTERGCWVLPPDPDPHLLRRTLDEVLAAL
jgi:WD40 repeat protein